MDLGAALQGGLGMAAPAISTPPCVDVRACTVAPKYAGTGKANPSGRSCGRLMLEHWASAEAAAVERAVRQCVVALAGVCTTLAAPFRWLRPATPSWSAWTF